MNDVARFGTWISFAIICAIYAAIFVAFYRWHMANWDACHAAPRPIYCMIFWWAP
jgi:hypothetical protein